MISLRNSYVFLSNQMSLWFIKPLAISSALCLSVCLIMLSWWADCLIMIHNWKVSWLGNHYYCFDIISLQHCGKFKTEKVCVIKCVFRFFYNQLSIQFNIECTKFQKINTQQEYWPHWFLWFSVSACEIIHTSCAFCVQYHFSFR